MGSAVLAHCAGRGGPVIGFEQFERGHELGAFAGRSRLIRKAYFEDPAYVPLLQRAYALWRELERETATDLLTITGVLLAGIPESEVLAGSQRAAALHDLPVETLATAELRERYPMLAVEEGEIGVLEEEAGVLRPEAAVEAHLRLAEQRGAEMRFGVAVHGWSPGARGFALNCGGETVTADALVLTMGPWFGEVMQSVGVRLRVQRNVQAWFAPASPAFGAGRFPGFLIDRPGFPAPLYGFPDFGEGVKAAFHGHGEEVDPTRVDRVIDQERDIKPIAAALEAWMPGAAHRFQRGKVCLYALTPDEHFVVDRHPAHRQVILCGGFSGHGFKFAPVIGEIASQLVFEEATPHPIEFLSLRRFGGKTGA